MNYLINDRLTNDGLTNDGLTNDGLTNDGLTNNGPVSDGLTNNGPVSDGLTNDGPISDVIEEIKTNIVANNVEIRPVIKKTYVVLDRRFRSEENADNTVMTWYLHNEKGKPEGAYISNQVKKIKAIKILDFSMGNTFVSTAISSKNTLRVLINELSAQSNIVDDGVSRKNYHFAGTIYPITNNGYSNNVIITFDTEYNDIVDSSKTIKNQNKYVFDPPINILEKISIQLDFIDKPMSFITDKFKITSSSFGISINYQVGITFNVENSSIIRPYMQDYPEKWHHCVFKNLYSPINTDDENNLIKILMNPRGWSIHMFDLVSVPYDFEGRRTIYDTYKNILSGFNKLYISTSILGEVYISIGAYSIELEIEYEKE